MPSDDRPLIFLSCGQRTDEEKQLGANIINLIEQDGKFQAYFAEQQNSLEGLTANIFENLARCVGFIAVLHPREPIRDSKPPQHRASVFIEQEVAIAAFIQQMNPEHKLHVAIFAHPKVQLEGVRHYLVAKARVFDSSADVLKTIEQVILPTWQPITQSAASIECDCSRAILRSINNSRGTVTIELPFHVQAEQALPPNWEVHVECPEAELIHAPEPYSSKIENLQDKGRLRFVSLPPIPKGADRTFSAMLILPNWPGHHLRFARVSPESGEKCQTQELDVRISVLGITSSSATVTLLAKDFDAAARMELHKQQTQREQRKRRLMRNQIYPI